MTLNNTVASCLCLARQRIFWFDLPPLALKHAFQVKLETSDADLARSFINRATPSSNSSSSSSASLSSSSPSVTVSSVTCAKSAFESEQQDVLWASQKARAIECVLSGCLPPDSILVAYYWEEEKKVPASPVRRSFSGSVLQLFNLLKLFILCRKWSSTFIVLSLQFYLLLSPHCPLRPHLPHPPPLPHIFQQQQLSRQRAKCLLLWSLNLASKAENIRSMWHPLQKTRSMQLYALACWQVRRNWNARAGSNSKCLYFFSRKRSLLLVARTRFVCIFALLRVDDSCRHRTQKARTPKASHLIRHIPHPQKRDDARFALRSCS